MSNPEAVGYIDEQGTFRGVYVHWGLGLEEFDLSLITDLGESDDPFRVIDQLVDDGVEFSDIAIPRTFGDGRSSSTPFVIEGFRDRIESMDKFISEGKKRHAAGEDPKPEEGSPAAALQKDLDALPYVNGIWVLGKLDQERVWEAVAEYMNLVDGQDWETLDEVGSQVGRYADEMDEDVYVEVTLGRGGLHSKGHLITFHPTAFTS